MKTRMELVEENRNAIVEEVKRCWRNVIESEGRVMYRIYIWEDGEIESLCAVSENEWLRSNTGENLYGLGLVKHQQFDWSEFCEEPIDWDNEERCEELKEEVTEWLIGDDEEHVVEGFFDRLEREEEQRRIMEREEEEFRRAMERD